MKCEEFNFSSFLNPFCALYILASSVLLLQRNFTLYKFSFKLTSVSNSDEALKGIKGKAI